MHIAVHQGPSGSDAIGTVATTVTRAADSGAELVVFPEMFTTGYHIGADILTLAEPTDGTTARAVARLATEHRVAIAYGYPERDGDAVFNAVQLIGPDGARLANYRKTHLYGDLDRTRFTPGERVVVQAEVHGLLVGLLICYDVEFPEAVRAHALAGTDLLLVPTALMSPYETVADTLVPARAYESQLYLAYANHTGQEGTLRYCGRSCVVAPTGQVLARGGHDDDLLLADIDPALLRASRAENTHLADRRPELYTALATHEGAAA
ncbi:carbon-nitrogen hydrolase family protein [Haloechinothrix halophila]|uniref:carbon-nitrogen hydrolase family protein n=1 Tax=Haloechinothrix halophila TaxID=1069073 RepID=UPI000407FDC1|nr:carbon-nitrogen hydrolase family protein [Haloechinothrix halophila]